MMPSRSALLDVQTHGQPSLAQISWQSWFALQYLPFEIRPELGTEIGGEIEPEPEGSLCDTQAHGIQPVRIPLVRKKGGAVALPSRQVAVSRRPVRARQYCAAERVAGSAPESRAARSIIPRVLVQRRIQTESENAIDRRRSRPWKRRAFRRRRRPAPIPPGCQSPGGFPRRRRIPPSTVGL